MSGFEGPLGCCRARSPRERSYIIGADTEGNVTTRGHGAYHDAPVVAKRRLRWRAGRNCKMINADWASQTPSFIGGAPRGVVVFRPPACGSLRVALDQCSCPVDRSMLLVSSTRLGLVLLSQHRFL